MTFVLTDWPTILFFVITVTALCLWSMSRPHTKYHDSDQCSVCREIRDE